MTFLLVLTVPLYTPGMDGQLREESRLILPEISSERSDALALSLLDLGSFSEAEESASLCENAGFEILFQKHFEKPSDDASHNCAFTVCKGSVLRGSRESSAILVVIRGTFDGEWYSNFDFCPSHEQPPLFAENFLFCAEDVFLSIRDLIDESDPETVYILTGISRGAACSNLLGLILNDYLSPERVYTYTFACPNTVGDALEIPEPDNIFNYINPGDLIPKVPIAEWGYTRPGTDIMLPQENEAFIRAAEEYGHVIADIAPTIEDYYQARHSLTGPGEDPFGVTPFELMLTLSNLMIECEPMISVEEGRLEFQGPGEIPSDLQMLSQESDYAELIGVFDSVFTEHREQVFALLLQHMPVSYKELIESLQRSEYVIY